MKSAKNQLDLAVLGKHSDEAIWIARLFKDKLEVISLSKDGKDKVIHTVKVKDANCSEFVSILTTENKRTQLMPYLPVNYSSRLVLKSINKKDTLVTYV